MGKGPLGTQLFCNLLFTNIMLTRRRPVQCEGKKKKLFTIVKNTISLLRTQMIKLEIVHS